MKWKSYAALIQLTIALILVEAAAIWSWVELDVINIFCFMVPALYVLLCFQLYVPMYNILHLLPGNTMLLFNSLIVLIYMPNKEDWYLSTLGMYVYCRAFVGAVQLCCTNRFATGPYIGLLEEQPPPPLPIVPREAWWIRFMTWTCIVDCAVVLTFSVLSYGLHHDFFLLAVFSVCGIVLLIPWQWQIHCLQDRITSERCDGIRSAVMLVAICCVVIVMVKTTDWSLDETKRNMMVWSVCQAFWNLVQAT